MTTRLDAPGAAALVSSLRAAAAAASDAERAAVLAFDEALRRAAPVAEVHAALAQFWAARAASGAAISGHLSAVADALAEAAAEFEHDDALVAGALT
jgi:hypothetical protein